MKRIIQNIIAVVVASIAFISCQQFKDAVNTSDVKELNAVVKVTLNLGNAPMPDVLNVKLINYAEKYEITKTMDPNGTVTIDKLYGSLSSGYPSFSIPRKTVIPGE